jgi:hypothetical protein
MEGRGNYLQDIEEMRANKIEQMPAKVSAVSKVPPREKVGQLVSSHWVSLCLYKRPGSRKKIKSIKSLYLKLPPVSLLSTLAFLFFACTAQGTYLRKCLGWSGIQIIGFISQIFLWAEPNCELPTRNTGVLRRPPLPAMPTRLG